MSPGAPPTPIKRATQCAQLGHDKHERALIPESAVVINKEPHWWHHVFDLHQVQFNVDEHQIYIGRCQNNVDVSQLQVCPIDTRCPYMTTSARGCRAGTPASGWQLECIGRKQSPCRQLPVLPSTPHRAGLWRWKSG